MVAWAILEYQVHVWDEYYFIFIFMKISVCDQSYTKTYIENPIPHYLINYAHLESKED